MVKFGSGGSDTGGNGKILIVVMMCEAGYQSNRVHSKPPKGIDIVEIPQKEQSGTSQKPVCCFLNKRWNEELLGILYWPALLFSNLVELGIIF